MNRSQNRTTPRRSAGPPPVLRLQQQVAALKLADKQLRGYVCPRTPTQVPNHRVTSSVVITVRSVAWKNAFTVADLRPVSVVGSLLKVRKIYCWGGQDWTTLNMTLSRISTSPQEDAWTATDVGTRTTCPCVSVVPAQDDWLKVADLFNVTLVQDGRPEISDFTTPATVDVVFEVLVDNAVKVVGTPPALPSPAP